MELTFGLRDAPCHSADVDLEVLCRTVDTYSLLEIQPALSELVRHDAMRDLVVVALGLANAGKSSLINRLLQNDILPVEATPTTAVATHIIHGHQSRGIARIVLRKYLQWSLRRTRLEAGLFPVFKTYLSRLHEWRRAALDDLLKAFTEACDRRSGIPATLAADLAYLQRISCATSFRA
ncbi:hypothetical protein CAL29_24435 [Bordetella genomosp. 10]|uniref:Dynamin N-terminal domain-containing protein n=1 Tax=Bordetella genomosp. 10 TaxID=1416804 RepID=A0A261S180_9BORD|nr:dynamin family protein [Bordetella genomosp. 10]OZI31086.1 hypothetical protein CAL29_24435 [Bordetella genomosp. 10]